MTRGAAESWEYIVIKVLLPMVGVVVVVVVVSYWILRSWSCSDGCDSGDGGGGGRTSGLGVGKESIAPFFPRGY